MVKLGVQARAETADVGQKRQRCRSHYSCWFESNPNREMNKDWCIRCDTCCTPIAMDLYLDGTGRPKEVFASETEMLDRIVLRNFTKAFCGVCDGYRVCYMGVPKPKPMQYPGGGDEAEVAYKAELVIGTIANRIEGKLPPAYKPKSKGNVVWPSILAWNLFQVCVYSYATINNLGPWWEFMPIYCDQWTENEQTA